MFAQLYIFLTWEIHCTIYVCFIVRYVTGNYHKSKGSPEKCIGCERVHIKWSRSKWAVKCNKKDIYITFIHNQLCCRIQICHKWVKESDISGICWFMYTRYFQDRCELFWSQWKYTAIGTDIYYFLWKRKKNMKCTK